MKRDIKPTYDELESYVENLQKQLADAQATIAALQARVTGLEKNRDKPIEQVDPRYWDVNELRANVELKARHIDEIQSQLTQRTAELERVRGELVETSLYLQQERANRDSLAACVDRDVKTIKELRTLILALPKVEGEIAVKETEIDLSVMWGITVNGLFGEHSSLFDTKEEADAYAALLQHRQGMEG